MPESIHLVDLTTVKEKAYAFYGVDCIVVTMDNKIILQKRGDNWQRFPGYLASFGGQIEMGETPMQALIRELREELGAQVKESEVISLGAVTEAVTGHTELIYVYFWLDLHGTISGCYEGKMEYFDTVQEITKQPKVMDDTLWALEQCLSKKLLPTTNIINNEVKVVPWNEQIEKDAQALLDKYKTTSFFLQSNLNAYGPRLTEDTYSGNFKCLVKNNSVIGVFALTKIGNLIVQTNLEADYTKIIIDECFKENIPLRGVVGDWELAATIWDYVKKYIRSIKETLRGKEVLFELILDHLVSRHNTYDIRYLEPVDYMAWDQLNTAYMQENNLDQRENEAARHQRFLQDAKNKYWYGLFIGKDLVSIACGISNIDNIVWIGGVYTTPSMRKQGLATELVYKLLLDCKIHKLKSRAILFTGENNIAAMKIYENLGFKRIGYFGIFFGVYADENG